MRDASPVMERIEALGVLPVIEIDDPATAGPLAEALVQGGVDALEVALRTDAALSAVAGLRAARPELLVGAGTVLSPAQADEAVSAGAAFIVAPGFNPKVVRHCVEAGIPVFPGVGCATDIELALEAGLAAVKFFPAAPLGGMNTLRAMAAPFRSRMRYIPLGGLGPSNMAEYARSGLILAMGGTWIAKSSLVRAGNFAAVALNAKTALRIAHGLRPLSIAFALDRDPAPAESGGLLEAFAALGAPLGPWGCSDGAPCGELRLACNNPSRTALWLRLAKGVASSPATPLTEGVSPAAAEHVLHGTLGGFTVRLVPYPKEETC